MEYILETNNLTKVYGQKEAAKDVNLHIQQGQIYGLIGRNGAGKTTIMRMISGLSRPTRGSYSLFGKTGMAMQKQLKNVGVLIEHPGLYPRLSAYENVKIKCIGMGIKPKGYVESLLKTVGLENTDAKKGAGSYSLGMRQRLGIALALVGDPRLIVLDEPINGLDPQGIVEIRELIARLSKERNITILISSHILEELSKIATRYGILHDGMLIDEFTHSELLRRCRERIEIRPSDPTKAATVIESMGITEYKIVDKNIIQIFERLEDSGEIVLELAKNNIKTLSINVKNEALEDYYLSITGQARR